MAEQKMSARAKTVRKMTRDGLVEKNLADQSAVRVSSRAGDVQMKKAGSTKGENVGNRTSGSKARRASGRRSAQNSRDAPMKGTVQQGGDVQCTQHGEPLRSEAGSGDSRAAYGRRNKGQPHRPAGKDFITEASEGSGGKRKIQEGRLWEKHAELSDFRGDARKAETGGSRKPQQKRRLKFAPEEKIPVDGGTVYKDGSDAVTARRKAGHARAEDANESGLGEYPGVENGEALSRLDDKNRTRLQHDLQKKRAVKIFHEADLSGQSPRKHSLREKVYQEHAEDISGAGKKHLKFEWAEENKAGSVGPSVLGRAGASASAALHREVAKNDDDDNAAVEGANRLTEGAERAYRLTDRSIRRQSRREERRTGYSARKAEQISAERAEKQEKRHIRKLIQKQRIRREYAKAQWKTQETGTAVKGTVDYIKKIGGKVTDFFKENRKVYIGIAVLMALLFLIMVSLTSCSALFFQNTVDYTGTSYMATDETLREVELYYTQLEADLQERINNMATENEGYDDYRYDIGPIEHDPFILLSYLSAKYEDFTFDQVKGELDELFALQYQLELEAVNETVTEKATVKVGESLGQVVTSGYCNCSICCGQWAGGPTASGAMPTAAHTLAVDASDPFVPMGTKVVMNGVEYTVEDTGAFARYGVQFDVYYGSHSEAQGHGHQTWECYLADDNGDQEVEVTRTRQVKALNVTLTNNSLLSICQNRLGTFEKELFSAYNEVKGNLQMFESPFAFNWYGNVSSYYGYRIHPVSGENQLHNGMDIGVPEGTEVMAGLTGTVTTSDFNNSYGNYVVIENDKGYELRYAHLKSRNVAAGDAIEKGDVIGLAGSTGNSTGSHLHIEVLKDGERLDPIFYLETGEGSMFGGSEYTSAAAETLLTEAARYLGTPYVWGGYSPAGFDCSGFVSYCLTNSGVRNTGRLTAQGLYDICTPVTQSDAQPGDLIFFTGTYDAGTPVTHVGIYVGNGQFIHCGHPVQYSTLTSYWQAHLYAFGRW